MAATEVQMDSQTSHRHGPSQTYGHLPASPTLTNPDMILPDYDRSVSPGPELDDARNHSPLMMWKNAHAAGPDLNQIFGNGVGQQHSTHPYGPTGPVTPTTPIIYGNGTMLSDIGEVTEVESTPGKPSPGRMRAVARRQQSPTRDSGSDAALRSSPTVGVEHTLKRRSAKNLVAHRERRDSGDSTSTITTQERTELFADFDDSVSVGDSVFQGDDEESVAESYAEQTARLEGTARLGVPQSDNLDRMSIVSSTSLGRRAEEILATAKRKLTTMEDNLTRARSSLHVSSPSMSSLGSGSTSTPSPPFKRPSTATYTRDVDPTSPSSPEHSRFSTDNVSGAAPASRIGTVRSASALGDSGGYRRPLATSRSEDHIRNSLDGRTLQRTSSILRDTPGLAPLTEDAPDSNGQLSEDGENSAKLDRFLSPTFGSPFSDNARPIQRSASVAQMRDIKDQMKDLKGRLSSLREQARSDSLKRRSLQSLRTPSPFTHAQVDQWYAEPKTLGLSSEIGSGNGSVGKGLGNGDVETIGDLEPVTAASESKEQSGEEEELFYSEIENNTQLRPPGGQSPERKSAEAAPEVEADAVEDDDDYISDMHTENGDSEDGIEDEREAVAEEGYYSESGESLYQDALQHPISHEDREDAFDYEHFFLHSAMGTLSRQRMGRRGSGGSVTSEDSVVTTRAINDADKDDPEPARSEGGEDSGSSRPNTRVRRSSDASISTVGTFATANEGSRMSPLAHEAHAVAHGAPGSSKSRPGSPDSARRITFASGTATMIDYGSRPSTAVTRHSITSFRSIPEEDGKENEDPYADFHPRVSVSRRPMSSTATASLHRPSVSSMESTGTTRSFPLVPRAKKANSIGVLTPQNSSPDQELKLLSDSLLDDTATAIQQQRQERGSPRDPKPKGQSVSWSPGTRVSDGSPTRPSKAMKTLLREDQYLVERLVADLGRCVLGLTESGKAGAESRMYRSRLEAARRILEGLDQV